MTSNSTLTRNHEVFLLLLATYLLGNLVAVGYLMHTGGTLMRRTIAFALLLTATVLWAGCTTANNSNNANATNANRGPANTNNANANMHGNRNMGNMNMGKANKK